jgi:hypothetical protein
MNLKLIFIAASLATLPVFSVQAQSTTYQQRHSANARDANQQNRINKGVADGQITPQGAATADAHQAHLNADQGRMRRRTGTKSHGSRTAHLKVSTNAITIM